MECIAKWMIQPSHLEPNTGRLTLRYMDNMVVDIKMLERKTAASKKSNI